DRGHVELLRDGCEPIDLGEPYVAKRAIFEAYAHRMVSTVPVDLAASALDRSRDVLFGPSRVLSEPSSRKALEALGIDSPTWNFAESPARAVAHAKSIGLPVSVRIASPDVSAMDHSDLAIAPLSAPSDVRDAAMKIVRDGRKTPETRVLGVVVERHV